MENTSDSFIPRPLLFCLESERSVCYSVPDNTKTTRSLSRAIGRIENFLTILDYVGNEQNNGGES